MRDNFLRDVITLLISITCFTSLSLQELEHPPYELENVTDFEKQLALSGLVSLLTQNADSRADVVMQFFLCHLEEEYKNELLSNWSGVGRIHNAWEIEVLYCDNQNDPIVHNNFREVSPDSPDKLIIVLDDEKKLEFALTQRCSANIAHMLFGE